ncbi:hypothetical protein IHQ71_28370 [Rhizobium sp. TH2]|uniref:hypothetical protein n=1 Tax=Rhizobium sp. TH2 TaxID=2775403 RepID=UPI0021572FA2|nr:hypothetical protein [Rhizobium sp. TH2]UVC08980.1 hypothetical protein IHQ71_28370 [Rhizobium sp. TH2]
MGLLSSLNALFNPVKKSEQAPTELFLLADAGSTSRLNIIFIHGLSGHYADTWQLTGSETPGWLKWITAAVPETRIYSLSYRLAMSNRAGGSMPIGARSINVLATIAAVMDSNLPTILICHSYGGLLAKRMLQTSLDLATEYEPIAKSIKGIVFLGTPNSGSPLADYLAGFRLITNSSVAVDELRDNQPELVELNNWFRNRLSKLDINILVFYETMQTHGLLVVDQTSANPGIPGVNPIGIDADHLDLPKPITEDVRVKRVQAFIKQIAGVAPPKQQFSPIQRIISSTDTDLPATVRRIRREASKRPHDDELQDALDYAARLRIPSDVDRPRLSYDMSRPLSGRMPWYLRVVINLILFGALVLLASKAIELFR